MQHYAVQTHALTKRFGKRSALADVTLELPLGGTHAIVGSNGAGKSTLFRLLLGMLTPSSGSSKILGEDSLSLSPQTRGRVGYVNEEHTLPQWMTAAQVTGFQRSFYPQWNEEVYRGVLGNFDVRAKQKVVSLSRGERAGLNLALALAQNPRLLILDEPTLGMDVVAKQAFLESLIFTGSDLQTTIIYCSHQMEEIERVADSLVIMECGQVRTVSDPDSFRARVGYWIANFPGPFSPQEVSGLLSAREIEGQWHLTALDRTEDLQSELVALGADRVQACAVNLETAVNAFLSKHHLASRSESGGASC